MPAYIVLYKFTQQGLSNINQAPDLIKQAKQMTEQMGGRTIGVWLTMGEYDLVAIGEISDDQTAAARILMDGMSGNVTTVTLRAFSEEEFAQIVDKLR